LANQQNTWRWKNLSFIVNEQLSNTSDKKVEKMSDNWSLRICVVNFTYNVDITLQLPRQQGRSLSTHTCQLLPTVPIPGMAVAQGEAHSSDCFRTLPKLQLH
jgi:hypothetical protein